MKGDVKGDVNGSRKGGVHLAVAAFAVIMGVSGVAWLTQDAVKESERQWLEQSLAEIVPSENHDGQLVSKAFTVNHPELGSAEPQMAYPIVKGSQWNGVALTAVAPDGYTGDIELLLAIDANQTLLGVRVLSHKETPGLGDDIERKKSEWITAFDQASLISLTAEQWNVKKDGGVFDQFTGATITPRAVVNTVHRVLQWYAATGEQALKTQFFEASP